MFEGLFFVSVVFIALLVIERVANGRFVRRVEKEKEEYKGLFEVSSSECKTQQQKIEEFFHLISQKDIWIERGSQAIENSNKLLKETQSILELRASEILSLQEALKFQEEQYDKLLGQKKSSETRLGQISEQIAPFLSDYPFDSKQARFIGDPIDLISFSEDKITFIEVKSGESQLTKRQRQIRDMIKEGKVDFMIYRIKGE